MRKKSAILSLLLLPSLLVGNLKKDLNKFFDSMGSTSNVNSADIYNGQKAGYATGGSLTVRNPSLSTKVATVNLPQIDAGCGGIDIYTGGFSFINSEQLISTLKSIGSSSAGYAFLLGLETVSPQMANTIRQLQSWANTINSIGINSCETAASLVGSVWPRNEMASQHICRTAATEGGIFSDHIKSRHGCKNPEEQQEVIESLSKTNPLLLIGNTNLAWKAIQRQKFFRENKSLAELFMTITGTLVQKVDESGRSIKTFPSKIRDSSFLKSILDGGNAVIYKCKDKEQCLIVEEHEIFISENESWGGKIKNILLSIQDKVIADEELSTEEQDFLSKSSLPLYKIVSIISAYKNRISPLDLYQVADIVAMDLLMQSLKDGIEVIRNGCKELREAQIYDNEITDFERGLDKANIEIKYYETKSHEAIEREMLVLQKMQILEDQISQELFLFR